VLVVCNFLVEYDKKCVATKKKLEGEKEEGEKQERPVQVVVSAIIQRFHDLVLLLQGKKGGGEEGVEGDACRINNLCHALVILLRNLPSARKGILEKGLCGLLLSCISRFRAGKIGAAWAKGGVGGWPIWFPSFFLLLDVLAQPMLLEEEAAVVTATTTTTTTTNTTTVTTAPTTTTVATAPATPSSSNSKLSELERSKKEAAAKKAEVGTVSKKIMAILAPPKPGSSTPEGAIVPSYHPLLPNKEAEHAVSECLALLSWRPASSIPLPPGVLHAMLEVRAIPGRRRART
jgi:hypothetical protein